MIDIHREKITHAHKDKPSKLPEQDLKHDITINMPKYDQWLINKKGCKGSTRPHGMSPSVCNHQGKKPRQAQKFDAEQNFGESCSHYNTHRHTI